MKAKIISVLLCAFLASAVMAEDTQGDPAFDATVQQFPTKALRDADAIYRRALGYENDSPGGKADHAKMIKLLKEASSRGSGIASYKLATYYASVPAEYKNEIDYWALARQQGYCAPPVVSNIRGPKANAGYLIHPCVTDARN